MANRYLILVGCSTYIAVASFLGNLDTGIEIRDRHETTLASGHSIVIDLPCQDEAYAIADTQDFKFESPLVGFIRLPEDIASATRKGELNVARGPPKV